MTAAIAKIEAIEEDVPVERLHHDVPVDEAHVALLMESIRQMGQLAPLLVRLETYELIDGFHRAEALRRLGIEQAACRLVDCTQEEFDDARITSAVLHKSVDFPRIAKWVLAIWDRSPWKDRLLLKGVFRFAASLRKPEYEIVRPECRYQVSTHEILQACEWAASKMQLWGLPPQRIAEIVDVAVGLPEHLIARVRARNPDPYGPLPSPLPGTITESTARAIVDEFPESDRARVIHKALAEGLHTGHINRMAKATNGVEPEQKEQVLATPWIEQERRLEEEKEAAERRPEAVAARIRFEERAAASHFMARVRSIRNKLRAKDLAFDKHPDLQKELDRELGLLVAEIAKYRGDTPDGITQLEAQVAALTKENQELKTALDNMRRGAGLANRIYQDELALRSER